MTTPPGTQTFEGELAIFWMDVDGILYAKSKSTPRNLERQKENYALIRKITGDKPVCLLCDLSSSNRQDKESKEYMKNELPKVFKAMALISNSAVGRMVANLLLSTKNSPIPIKVFDTEEQAKAWLLPLARN